MVDGSLHYCDVAPSGSAAANGTGAVGSNAPSGGTGAAGALRAGPQPESAGK